MRILMLNNEYPPLGGGTGTVNEAILNEFSRYPELDIDLVTSSAGEAFEAGLLFDRFRIFRLPVNRYNIHHASNAELLRYAWKAFWFSLKLHRKEKYDICMAWSTVPAGGTALALRLVVGLPYIVRVTGPDIPGFEARYDRWTMVLKPFIRGVWHRAHIVIAKCHEEESMVRAVASKLTMRIIPNGVDRKKFSVERFAYQGPIRLLCVGRLIERKGHRDLIEAGRRLIKSGFQIRCQFVGTGDAEEEYKTLIEEAGLESVFEFSGYVPRERMPQIYASADVFVLPSYNEGMSISALEAMAAGLPLILSKTGGTDVLVVEGRNGFRFEPGDVDSLYTCILRMIQNKELAREMGYESQRYSAMFSWDAIGQSYKQVIINVTE